MLGAAVEQATAAGSERDALRARVQLLSNYVYRSPTEAEVDAAADEARRAAASLEALGDETGMAEVAITIEYLEFMRGDLGPSFEWASAGLAHALRAGLPRESAQLAADIVHTAAAGPLPFGAFDAHAEDAAALDVGPIATSVALAMRAIAALAAGDPGAFAEQEAAWREIVDGHGLQWLAGAHSLAFGAAELWVDAEAAERRLRDLRDVLAATGDLWWLGTIDASIAATLVRQGQTREFLTLADTYVSADLVPDRDAMIRREILRSHALLLRGSPADAEAAARRGLAHAERSSLALATAEAHLTLERALVARDLADEANVERERALDVLTAKGHRAALEVLGAASASSERSPTGSG
jgi:hypothetical protein